MAKLIAGPGVYICDQCVGLCNQILAEIGLEPSDEPRLPMWETMSDEQMLDHMVKVVAVRDQVDGNLREWVGELRNRNVSWERIGAALGMTRQSAWERFK